MSESKAQQIDRVKANLPLPEQPPQASDWQSADARTVNVGADADADAGRIEAHIGTSEGAKAGLRGPAATTTEKSGGGVDMAKIGRQGVEGLQGRPADAEAK